MKIQRNSPENQELFFPHWEVLAHNHFLLLVVFLIQFISGIAKETESRKKNREIMEIENISESVKLKVNYLSQKTTILSSLNIKKTKKFPISLEFILLNFPILGLHSDFLDS